MHHKLPFLLSKLSIKFVQCNYMVCEHSGDRLKKKNTFRCGLLQFGMLKFGL